VLLHPVGEELRLGGAFLVAEITRDKTAADREPGVRVKDHVGQLRLRRDQVNVRDERLQLLVEAAPLCLHERRVRGASAAHPGIDLVLDGVVVRRTKKQLAHNDD
jgi:hypothetical protein